MERPGAQYPTGVVEFTSEGARPKRDRVATEEPLEIRIISGEKPETVAITMRTPGADFELAAGFLFSEGVLEPDQLSRISYCVDRELDEEQRFNIVNVASRDGRVDLPSLQRHFLTSSSCGVCGRAQLESLEDRDLKALTEGKPVPPSLVLSLPEKLREAQAVFDSTGGLHAAALFDRSGSPIVVREDVGRHNAVDKVVGWALMNDRLPASETVGMVSGRVSYEIVQKFLVAGVPIVCAVSAPSSLAIDVATRFGMTLVGFLRDGRFNVYAGTERIGSPSKESSPV